MWYKNNGTFIKLILLVQNLGLMFFDNFSISQSTYFFSFNVGQH